MMNTRYDEMIHDDTDTVHDIHNNFRVFDDEGCIFAFNKDTGTQVGEGGGPGAIKSWRDQKDDAGYPKNDSDIPENWEEQYHKDFPTSGGLTWPLPPSSPPPNTGKKGHSGSSSSHAAVTGGQGGIIPYFGPNSITHYESEGSGYKSQSNSEAVDEYGPVNQLVYGLDTRSKPVTLNTLERSVHSKLRPTGGIIDNLRGQVIGTTIGKLSGKNTVIYPSKPSKNKTGRLVQKAELLQAPTSSKTVQSYVWN